MTNTTQKPYIFDPVSGDPNRTKRNHSPPTRNPYHVEAPEHDVWESGFLAAAPPTQPDQTQQGEINASRSENEDGQRIEEHQDARKPVLGGAPGIHEAGAVRVDRQAQPSDSPDAEEAPLAQPVPIQGEGPYGVDGTNGSGFYVTGPTLTTPDTNYAFKSDAQKKADELNAIFQAGASSKDQVVEAAEESDDPILFTIMVLSHAMTSRKGGDIEWVRGEIRYALERLTRATALNANSETEKENG